MIGFIRNAFARSMKTAWCAAVILVLGIGLATPSSGQIIYSNLGPGDSYYNYIGWSESGPTSWCGPYRLAVSFVPDDNYTLGSIEMALRHVQGVNNASVCLAADNSGKPGSLLESLDISATNGTSLLSFDSVLKPTLDAGARYWIYLAANGDASFTWYHNSIGAQGWLAKWQTIYYPPWSGFSGTVPALRVSGKLIADPPDPSVPEPGAVAMLAGCSVPVLALIRRRR